MAIQPNPGRVAAIRKYAARLRHPHLFLIVLGLLAVDIFVPTPMLVVDELLLGLLAALLASWKERRDPPPPEAPTDSPADSPADSG